MYQKKKCPVCDASLQVWRGRRGRYYKCSNPSCQKTINKRPVRYRKEVFGLS